MTGLRTATVKCFQLAILEFLPTLKELKAATQKEDVKEQLEDLIEAYWDIEAKIEAYQLNYDDPNKFYEGEPHDIDLNLSNEIVENLSRLSHRLLLTWQKKLQRLEKKPHQTDENKKEMHKLENYIWPLELAIKNKTPIIGSYTDKGPLVFPGEDLSLSQEEIYDSITNQAINTIQNQRNQNTTNRTAYIKTPIFPQPLIKKIPQDIAVLCEEFNFNYQNEKPNAGILLLRRILPLSIVRKFQKLGKETDIKNTTGDFLDTKPLLEKIKPQITNRIYNSIITYKDLLDSSQHSYSLNVHMDDTVRAAEQIRIFLDAIF